jgi:hypothetical protein
MDPIHPIVPRPPGITPITPAPMAGRIDREAARRDAEERKRRRKRADAGLTSGESEYVHEYGVDYAADDGGGDDDDSGLHISVTA